MSVKLEFHLLGKVRLVAGGRTVNDTLSAKAQALLCYLAVTGKVHTGYALAGLLWGDAPEEKAKNSLRVTLAALRKVCLDHLSVTHQTIAFNRESTYWLEYGCIYQRDWRLPPSTLHSLLFLSLFSVNRNDGHKALCCSFASIY